MISNWKPLPIGVETTTINMTYNKCIFCKKEVNCSSLLVRRADGLIGPVCDDCKGKDWKDFDIVQKL